MRKPPGPRWRIEGDVRKLYWRASKKAVAEGFPVKNCFLWRGPPDPTEEQMERITDKCLALAREQRDWLAGKRSGCPAPSASVKGAVYFVRSGNKIKIGFSTNMSDRLSQLQTASADKLDLVGTIDCTADREGHLHRTFSRYRLHGEWFRIEGDLATFLQTRFAQPGARGAQGSCKQL